MNKYLVAVLMMGALSACGHKNSEKPATEQGVQKATLTLLENFNAETADYDNSSLKQLQLFEKEARYTVEELKSKSWKFKATELASLQGLKMVSDVYLDYAGDNVPLFVQQGFAGAAEVRGDELTIDGLELYDMYGDAKLEGKTLTIYFYDEAKTYTPLVVKVPLKIKAE